MCSGRAPLRAACRVVARPRSGCGQQAGDLAGAHAGGLLDQLACDRSDLVSSTAVPFFAFPSVWILGGAQNDSRWPTPLHSYSASQRARCPGAAGSGHVQRACPGGGSLHAYGTTSSARYGRSKDDRRRALRPSRRAPQIRADDCGGRREGPGNGPDRRRERRHRGPGRDASVRTPTIPPPSRGPVVPHSIAAGALETIESVP